jgi:SAM-dependent methyltransferase
MSRKHQQPADGGYRYDAAFMDYAVLSNSLSARAIIGLLMPHLSLTSVLDIGCATGTWLKEWKAAGITDVCGVDGSYVNRERLQIAPQEYKAWDLSQPFNLGRVFDLVQSLEVAEHLPATASDQFVTSLVAHATGLILFSAAPPGQGGEFHINERPYAYWRAQFREHGYRPFDFIRPHIVERFDISFWYRFNMLLYVRDDCHERLSPAVRVTGLSDDVVIPDVSPLMFRVRKLLLRQLPHKAQHQIARLKAQLAPRKRI